jgi:peptidoglycan hydrolase-like protein with peptidoglycan-binding domain
VKSLYRFSTLLVALVLLVPVSTAVAKKRGHSAGSLGERTLKEGDSGRDVRLLQRFLNRAGVRLTADGEFGPATTAAVRAFERFQRRPVDGRVSRSDVIVLKDVAMNGGAVASAASTGGALPKNRKMPKPEVEPEDATAPLRLGPGMVATVGSDGLAVAPAAAPDVVKAIIEAGNRIATKPYIYGGGHGRWEDAGYDCSGSVSYALHGAGLLDQSMPSGGFMNWGDAGPGQWVTTYANGGHIFMVVAGLRFDTSGRSSAGSRWQADMRSGSGYSVRHPSGL